MNTKQSSRKKTGDREQARKGEGEGGETRKEEQTKLQAKELLH